MPLIAVVNKKRLLASHFSQSLWQRLPHLLLLLLQLQLLLCLQLVAVLPANCKCVPVPVRWSTSHPFSHSAKPESIHSARQAFIHSLIRAFTHSTIQHSVSHLASYAVSPPPSEFRTQCSRSLAICLQPGGRASNLMRVASCQSQLHHHHHPLASTASCGMLRV